jgi:hypothetical protein
MTTKQILRELKEAGKLIQIAQLYRYFLKFHIDPLGPPQRPQIYPNDSATKILLGLGWEDIKAERTAQVHISRINGNGNAASRPARPTSGTETKMRAVAGIASMKQLRAERTKARGTK